MEELIPDLHGLGAIAGSLGIGLLIGLERERDPRAQAGVRSFSLIALAGTCCAVLSERTGASSMLAVGALAVAAVLLMAAYVRAPKTDDAGTTTSVAGLMCYTLGAISWYGMEQLAAAIALVATMLLYFRSELHLLTHRLTRQDLLSLLQFAVITLVVLPVLPDHGYGPYGALNPYRIWLMVVIVVAVSLSGYAALRLLGGRGGVVVAGVLGGLVTSTATTLLYARHWRAKSAPLSSAILVVLIANMIVLVRVAALAAVLAPGLLPLLSGIFVAALLADALLPVRIWLKMERAQSAPHMDIRNPAELPLALGIGALFALALLLSSRMNAAFGSTGVYGAAAAIGLVDLDSITLSTLRMFNLRQLAPMQAVNSIVIAYCANLVFKLCAATLIGGPQLGRGVASGYLCLFAGRAT